MCSLKSFLLLTYNMCKKNLIIIKNLQVLKINMYQKFTRTRHLIVQEINSYQIFTCTRN